jgi:regulator of replication initiation timing
MLDNLKKIADLLPEGLSETAVEELVQLCQEAVEAEVEKEVRVLESKVDGFLRTKVSDLKEAARKELEADEPLIREARAYRKLRQLIAEDVEQADVDSVVSENQEKIAELESKLGGLNEQLESALRENKMLTDKASVLTEENAKLSEKSKLPAKLKESAVVITNNPDEDGPEPKASINNPFLTEQSLNLAFDK